MAGRCGCSGACTCALSGTPSVGIVGNGSTGGPFRASVIPNPAPWNLVVVDGAGVSVRPPVILGPDGNPINPDPADPIQLPAPCILDYNGDPIAPNPAGCVQLPAAGVPPAFGCGLATLEDGTLIAGVRAWPTADLYSALFAGTVDDGSPIYCDTDGLLRGAPEHTSTLGQLSMTLLDPTEETVPIGGTYTSPVSPGVTVVNVSPSRQMNLVAHLTAVPDIASPALSGTVVLLQYRINGGSWQPAREVRWPEALNSDGPTIREARELNGRVGDNILASNGWTIEARVQVSNTGTGDPATVVAIKLGLVILGVTS